MEGSQFCILDGGSATELVRQGQKSIDVRIKLDSLFTTFMCLEYCKQYVKYV